MRTQLYNSVLLLACLLVASGQACSAEPEEREKHFGKSAVKERPKEFVADTKTVLGILKRDGE